MTSSSRTKAASGIDWLLALAVLAVAATFVRAIYFTPVEALSGRGAEDLLSCMRPSAFVGLYVAFGLVARRGSTLPVASRRTSRSHCGVRRLKSASCS